MEKIIDWEKTSPQQVEIPFKPARVLLQVLIVHVLCLKYLETFDFARVSVSFRFRSLSRSKWIVDSELCEISLLSRISPEFQLL